jgi:hypothetical protein
VNGGWPVPAQSGLVDQRRVALVAFEGVDGKVVGFFAHDAIPNDLCQYGGGGDGHAPSVAIDDRPHDPVESLGISQLCLSQQVHRPIDQDCVG